ncbi:MAG: fibronectin type III domain-containing protein [bacterium]
MTRTPHTIWKTILTAGLLTVSLLMAGNVSAQSSLVVEFENTPLFGNADIKPGDSEIRWIKVTDNSGAMRTIAIEAINFPGFPDINSVPSDDLSRALLIAIRLKGGADLYGGSAGAKTLFEFYQIGEISLSDINNGVTEEYEVEIDFPIEKGNEWQGKTTGFDLLVGLKGKEEGEPIEPTEPTEPPGGEGGGGGGGGGGGLPRGLTILDPIRVDIGEDCSVNIYWLTNYFSTTQVVYGAEDENHILDLNDNSGTPPTYGYAHTTPEQDVNPKVTYHQMTLTELEPGTTYYYRSISRASPPTISKNYSFQTPATCFCEEEPAPEEPIVETPIGGQPEEPKYVYSGDTSGTITGEVPKEEEEELEEEITESCPEAPLVEEPSRNIFGSLIAGIGDLFANLFKGLGDLSCVPWCLILVLLIYTLAKWNSVRQNSKEEPVGMTKDSWKRSARIWFIWSLIILVIFIIYYPCISLWIFIAAVVVTLFILYLSPRREKRVS